MQHNKECRSVRYIIWQRQWQTNKGIWKTEFIILEICDAGNFDTIIFLFFLSIWINCLTNLKKNRVFFFYLWRHWALALAAKICLLLGQLFRNTQTIAVRLSQDMTTYSTIFLKRTPDGVARSREVYASLVGHAGLGVTLEQVGWLVGNWSGCFHHAFHRGSSQHGQHP